GSDAAIAGERLRALVDLVANLDLGLRAFGRRNLPLRAFLARAHPETGLLPLFHVTGPNLDAWLYTAEERQAYNQDRAPDAAMPSEDGAASIRITELHEVRTLNKWLTQLHERFGLRADVLLPREVTGDEPPPRFVLVRDGDEHPLLDLRELVAI